MATNEIVNEIRQNVLSFFKNNYIKCLDALIKAEDSKLGEIYQQKTNFKDYIRKTDILILTANKFETNILHKSINDTTKKNIMQCNYKFHDIDYDVYFFQWGQYYCAHVMALSTGSNTINGSEDMVRMMFKIKEFNPLAVLSFGICFGINHITQTLGDIIISNKVYSYGVGIKIKNGKIEISDDNNFKVSENVCNKIRNLLRINKLSDRNGEFFKHYITGEAVVSNEEFKQTIIKEVAINNDILAGEMEGYGIFKECEKYGKTGDGARPVPCIIVKSICDWGAEKNGFLDRKNNDCLDDLTDEHKTIDKDIKTYYINKDIKPPVNIETIIKDSIQAYAAQRAFNTCDKIFESENMVFGVNPYNYICNKMRELHSKYDKGIDDAVLRRVLTEKYNYLSNTDINDIISELIRQNEILDKDETGFYKYIERAAIR